MKALRLKPVADSLAWPDYNVFFVYETYSLNHDLKKIKIWHQGAAANNKTYICFSLVKGNVVVVLSNLDMGYRITPAVTRVKLLMNFYASHLTCIGRLFITLN